MGFIDEDIFKTLLNEQLSYGAEDIVAAVYAALQDTPTVDAVKVVNCKDCLWYEKGKDYEPYCNHPSHGIPYPKDDDFCSYGERRDGEGNG